MLTRNRKRSNAGSSTALSNVTTNPRYSPQKCRICLDDGEIPIFGVTDISEDVVEFGKIEVSKDDGLPQHLCEACSTLLEAAILFRRTAIQADKVLRKPEYIESKPLSIYSEEVIESKPLSIYSEEVIESKPLSIYSEEVIESKPLSIYSEEVIESKPLSIYSKEVIESKPLSIYSEEVIESKPLSIYSEEDSDIKNESEPFIKREYLELNYSSDSMDDFDIIEQEDTTDSNFLIYDTDQQESNNCKDLETNIVKEERQDKSTKQTDNEMVMIYVSDKDNQRISKPGCPKCYLVFDTFQELAQHSEKAHPKLLPTQRNCEICLKTVSKNTYEAHIQEHREKYKKNIENKYGKVECEFCNKKVSKAYIKQHLKMHGTAEEQAERFVECPICSKKISAHYYSDHIRRMHDKKNLKSKETPQDKDEEETPKKPKFNKCPVCDKDIIEREYTLHLLKHGGQIKQYICDKCGKIFKHQSAFKTHSLTHGSELKYKCQFCPYRGLHQGLLKIHVRTHTGDYNYKCTECPARFITKSNLTKHLQRHKGICNYKCEVCKKGYYTKRDVERHIQNVHLMVKSHICEVCGKSFNHRDNLLNHQLKVHKRDKIISRGRMPSYLKADQKHLDLS